MTAALRLWQGGPGMAMGLGTILVTAGIGTLFHRLRPRHPGVTRLPALFGFGLLLHAAMLAFRHPVNGGSLLVTSDPPF